MESWFVWYWLFWKAQVRVHLAINDSQKWNRGSKSQVSMQIIRACVTVKVENSVNGQSHVARTHRPSLSLLAHFFCQVELLSNVGQTSTHNQTFDVSTQSALPGWTRTDDGHTQRDQPPPLRQAKRIKILRIQGQLRL